jgi:hypothetical protein
MSNAKPDGNPSASLIDPTTKFPKPPFPEQHQPWPWARVENAAQTRPR